MTRFELMMDLTQLLSCELVRFNKKDNDFSILVVADSNGDGEVLDMDSFSSIQGQDDCCSMNGRLFTITFKNVSNLIITGEECDNYKTLAVNNEDKHLVLSFEGHNFYEDDNSLEIELSYESYEVKDEGKIKTPNC